MGLQIDYFDLDKEYPINYKFWEDGAALFLYGYYKLFRWQNSFADQAYYVGKFLLKLLKKEKKEFL